MTPEEQFLGEVWWILRKLNYLKTTSATEEVITFLIEIRPFRDPNEPTPFAQEKALLKLARRRVIKIIRQDEEDTTYGKDFIYELEIPEKIFNRFYKEWQEINDDPWTSQGTKNKQLIKLLEGKWQETERQEIFTKITFKKLQKIIEKEKVKAKAIINSTDHIIFRNLWFNINEILNAIYKSLSPLEGIRTQTISLNPNSLPSEQQNLLTSVLENLLKIRLATFPPKRSSAVITSEPVRRFLKGESILIKDRNKFENYKRYISELCHYIEEDGKARFLEVYSLPTTTQSSESPIQKGIKKNTKGQEQFEIKVKDRQIWVNDYFLSKPHAVGSNLEFFEYIRSQPKNIKIERNKLPDFGGSCLKKDIQNKGFIKILNELGFKGGILKAYFPKRGKNKLIYRGDKITKKDLEKAGVKMTLFLKELELAHLKNSPE